MAGFRGSQVDGFINSATVCFPSLRMWLEFPRPHAASRKSPPVRTGQWRFFWEAGSCRCCQELLLFQQSELQGDPLQQMDAGANSCLVWTKEIRSLEDHWGVIIVYKKNLLSKFLAAARWHLYIAYGSLVGSIDFLLGGSSQLVISTNPCFSAMKFVHLGLGVPQPDP